MLCARPYKEGVAEFGCGQCMPCRLNHRRMWTMRLVLESYLHPASYCCTLTYDEEHCPVSVSVRDAQLFLKRLRKRMEPLRLRYYLVGEYGDNTYRPHYHAALFGLQFPDYVQECWGQGHCDVQPFGPLGAQYVAGYVTKKMTSKSDPRLEGRAPEFARMSLKPGIGAGAAEVIHESRGTEVPSVLRMEQKLWPLGRYIRGKLKCITGEVGEDSGFMSRIRERQAELRLPGARAALEEKRKQGAAVARGRDKISKSRRGL